MALVTGFEKQNIHPSKLHPTETRCDYAAFEHNGRQYLQISSSGSTQRQTPGHVTQTYQFDRESAGELMSILRSAFPELT